MAVSDLKLNDTVALKKPHACGGIQWKITRTGADFKLQCLTCGHTVLLEREALEKKIRK
ncbi:MAG: DUF951 domain-containing protein [Firmicutes bacterium]|nr:DUF951 domain-containing protein [Bacillota bacterium]